jgi:hypothetical protein
MYQTSNSAHVLHLSDQLSKSRMKEGQTIADYLKELANLRHQLTSIGEEIAERELVERILNTLPESFDSVINSLSNFAQLPSLANISRQLLLHENRMQIRQKNRTREEALMIGQGSGEALLVRRGGYPFPANRGSHLIRRSDDHHHDSYGHGGHARGRGYGRGGHSQIGPCNLCGAYGHLLRNCDVLSQEISKPRTEHDQMRSFLHSTHLVEDNYSDEGPGQVDVFQMSLDSLDIDKNSDWYVDSGASASVTGNRIFFKRLDYSNQSSTITTAGDRTHAVEGKGVVEFVTPNGEIKEIDNVLYVPTLTKNLISVGALTDKGVMFTFNSNECLLIRRPNEILAKGIRDPSNGLYKFQCLARASQGEALFVSPSSNQYQLTQLWHQRFAHLHVPNLVY